MAARSHNPGFRWNDDPLARFHVTSGPPPNLALPLSTRGARALALTAALVMGACVGEASPSTAGRSPEADSARVILERASPALASEAFARLDSLAYVADVRFLDSGTAIVTRSVRHDPADEAPAGRDSAFEVTNPVDRMLPDDPPHLALRTRDRYRVRLLPEVRRAGRRLVGAEASLADPTDSEPVRRVRSWIDAETGAPYSVEAWRKSTSAIFDEESSAGVAFVVGRGGILPTATTSVTTVDVPFGESRRIRVDVAIRAAER